MENKICATCHNHFMTSHKDAKYCSLKCRDKNKSKVIKCLVCGRKSKIPNTYLRRGNNAGKFCSQICYTKFSIGENNPNWRGGITYDRNKKANELKKLRPIIRERDNYTCQKCGATGEGVILDVHHIIPYRLTQDNSIDNLQLLCHNCHMKEAKNELKLFK